MLVSRSLRIHLLMEPSLNLFRLRCISLQRRKFLTSSMRIFGFYVYIGIYEYITDPGYITFITLTFICRSKVFKLHSSSYRIAVSAQNLTTAHANVRDMMRQIARNCDRSQCSEIHLNVQSGITVIQLKTDYNDTRLFWTEQKQFLSNGC